MSERKRARLSAVQSAVARVHGTRLHPMHHGLALLCTMITLCMCGFNAYAYAHCNEDAACWNWRTMGNHKRGITLKNGKHVMVNGAQFDAYKKQRRIDWQRTPHLKGDG